MAPAPYLLCRLQAFKMSAMVALTAPTECSLYAHPIIKMCITVLTFHTYNSPVMYSYDWVFPFYSRGNQSSLAKGLVQDHTLLAFARSREADPDEGSGIDPPVLSHICRTSGHSCLLGCSFPGLMWARWAMVLCLCMDLVEVDTGG